MLIPKFHMKKKINIHSMEEEVKKLSLLVERIPDQLDQISDQDFEHKPSPEKWSIKEIVGHLVDSAMNNIQRYVRVQYMDTGKFVYQQDDWVRLQNYQMADRKDLVDLWRLMNLQLIRIWMTIPIENLDRKCDIGKDQEQILDLKLLAKDYVDHLQHHLSQIVG